jgi:hypothetical protein
MATRLKNMKIRRVSLVDEPASADDVTKAGAFIELFKAANPFAPVACPGCGKDVVPKDGKCPECGAALGEAEKACKPNDEAMKSAAVGDTQATAEVPPVTEEDEMSDELKAQVEKIQADLAVVVAERDVLKAAVAAVENSPEAIQKRKLEALPEEIKKQLTDQAEKIQKMEAAAEEVESIEKARGLGILGTTPEKLGPIMLRVRKGKATEEDAKEIERVFKALSAQVDKSKFFAAIGSDGNDGDVADLDPSNEIIRKARKLMSEDKGLDMAAAQQKVCAENPELYERARRSSYVQKSAREA